MSFKIPTLTVHEGDKVRLRTYKHSDFAPTGTVLYVHKIQDAPDGSRVIWLSVSKPHTDRDSELSQG